MSISSRRVALTLCALVMGALVVAGVQASANAHDHRPPEAILMKGERELQRGNLGSYCWTRPAGDGSFVGECSDAVSGYPAAERVGEDSKMRIRIFKTQRPRDFSLSAYRKIDADGFGRARRIPFSLRRVVEDGETVAWDAVFNVNQPNRHYYLDAFGIWKDEQGGGNQDASWTFHVKTGG